MILELADANLHDDLAKLREEMTERTFHDNIVRFRNVCKHQ